MIGWVLAPYVHPYLDRFAAILKSHVAMIVAITVVIITAAFDAKDLRMRVMSGLLSSITLTLLMEDKFSMASRSSGDNLLGVWALRSFSRFSN